MTSEARRGIARLDGVAGGPARRVVIATLAAVLALDSADKATIGAASEQLQRGLGTGKTGIGFLLAVTSLVGGLATLPAGVLVDRVTRVRLLQVAVACWAVAMLACAAAPSYLLFVLAQVGLGVVTAVAGPAVASLLGDYTPARERGRMYGLVLSGELVGTGIGFAGSGLLATLGWRVPFATLALPAVGVVFLLRHLPEPARGGPSRIPGGATDLRGRDAIESGDAEPYPDEPAYRGPSDGSRTTPRVDEVDPDQTLVVRDDPERWSLWRATCYVLRVRTNLVLVVSSALGYFFFAGVRGFGIEFVRHHYRISQATASMLTLVLGVGALAGVMLGGRLADRLLRRGHPTARVLVAGGAVLLTAVLLVPILLVRALAVGVLLLGLAAALLGAANPALDAARLDIMPAQLWGRAEGVRSVLRNGMEAVAPVLFGLLAQHVFGGAQALRDTFFVMLAPLLGAGLLALVVARRTYPHDVATATASQAGAAGRRADTPS